MAKRDPTKTLRNQRIAHLTDQIDGLKADVLKLTGFESELSLNSTYGGKYAEYIDAIADPAVLQAEVDRLKFEAMMRKWDAHFAKYAVELKENYYDWYITLDYGNGNYTIGPTRAASKAAFEEKYGARERAYTGHIGTA